MTRRNARRSLGDDALALELSGLRDLSVDELKKRWRELFGIEPPRRLGRLLMVRAIAYKLQEQAFGGLKAATRRRLKRAAESLADGRTPCIAPAPIKPGVRLLREWQGVMHEVIVLEEGVRYRGENWRSLSAVARAITGARWSGPRFFGLKERCHDQA